MDASSHPWLVLNLLPGIGPVRVRNLIERFGGAERILKASVSELKSVQGLGPETANQIRNWEDTVDLEAELEKIEDHDLRVLTWEDELFPPLLREIHDPPLVLYVRGRLTERDKHAIAIVGSRKMSHYGRSSAQKLSFQLAHAGYTVISGLARGIDTAAHEGALAAKGRTIAVLGCGIGKLYPPENATLAERIAQSGAVISEFPVDYPPDKQSFPLRNRVVSGMSHGVLVVEAPPNSGSLITADLAMQQNRNVYAVPGQIDRPASAGTNQLIRDGASLVTDARDIMDDLSLLPFEQSVPSASPKGTNEALTGDELTLMQALEQDTLYIDDLIQNTGLPVSRVASGLLRLEMKRFIRQLPGKRFEKNF